jgi:hypothetical protein
MPRVEGPDPPLILQLRGQSALSNYAGSMPRLRSARTSRRVDHQASRVRLR